MTLDQELDIPECNVKLYYHSERRPSEEKVKKICESLQLAREISNEAAIRLQAVLKDAPEDDQLARTVTDYHFKVNAGSPKNIRDKVTQVMGTTAAGLKDPVTLSDVLSHYWWDLYKIYLGKQEPDNVRQELGDKFRPKSEEQPTADRSRSGYVLAR